MGVGWMSMSVSVNMGMMFGLGRPHGVPSLLLLLVSSYRSLEEAPIKHRPTTGLNSVHEITETHRIHRAGQVGGRTEKGHDGTITIGRYRCR